MDNASRYLLGAIIGVLFGFIAQIWISAQLNSVRPLPSHRVSVDNDRHVYWCNEYAPVK